MLQGRGEYFPKFLFQLLFPARTDSRLHSCTRQAELCGCCPMWLMTLVEKRDEEELEKLPDPVTIPAAQSLQWEPVWPVVLLHDAGPTEACNWDQPSFWGCLCPAPSHCISGTATLDYLKLAPVIQAILVGTAQLAPPKAEALQHFLDGKGKSS